MLVKFFLSRQNLHLRQLRFVEGFRDFKRWSQYFQLLADPFNIDADQVPVEFNVETIDLQSRDILKTPFKQSPWLFFFFLTFLRRFEKLEIKL